METFNSVILPLLIVAAFTVLLIAVFIGRNKTGPAWLQRTAFPVRLAGKWLLHMGGITLRSSPGWFARYAPIGISILSLVLAYLSYHSQKETQEETTAERILVHLNAIRFSNELSANSLTPKCEVGMEIVNIGLLPLFIKRAEMRIRGDILTFYEHDPIPPLDVAKNEPMKSLGPSEEISYKLGWDFEKREEINSQIEDGSYIWRVGHPDFQMKDIEVQVQTTKKTFAFQHQIVNVTLLAKAHEDRKGTSTQSPDH